MLLKRFITEVLIVKTGRADTAVEFFLRQQQFADNGVKLLTKLSFMTFRSLNIFSLMLFFIACKTTRESGEVRKFEVVITLTSTESYCGGARPPEGLEEKLSTPIPFSSEKLYIRRGEWNDVNAPLIDSCITDISGKATFLLAPGKYCIVTAAKADSVMFEQYSEQYKTETANWNAINKKCLEEWLRTPELQIEVGTERRPAYSLNIHKPCPWHEIPCAGYKGPLPP